MTKKMVQLTIWERPKLRFHSVHGFVNWETYLECEKDRIAKVPGRVVEIRVRNDGQMSRAHLMALFVNDIGIESRVLYESRRL
jgi:hypothetical protein